ncbi:MAG TPA: cytochrome c peroxidase [Cyclobacteriaceae bacterium]|jgi:cytochrome c peroxidase|nr:cytochrome c peroxidase [Cyclobacteriaceae bacterium]
MAKRVFIPLSILLAMVGLYSCQQKDDPALTTSYLDLPQTPYQYNSGAPNDNIPTLGRVLFYDSRLSANSTISCSSCHKQASAFSDNRRFSLGFLGQQTARNSMPIQNLRARNFPNAPILDSSFVSDANLPLFWDGRETLIAAQVLMPITNHIEMGMTIDDVVSKLSSFSEYSSLFADAYGDSQVTEGRIAIALSRFISSINTSQSKFDLSRQGKAELSAQEANGFSLFLNKYNCNSCHRVLPGQGIQFIGDSIGSGYVPDQAFLDIGLDASPNDIGRADVTHAPSDIGRFKIPTLRNVALTAPYMHDGRFATLNEVIDHYSSGIANSPNLDIILTKNNVPNQMMISETEKQSIIAFLNTLTDYQMITDPKFSSPFKSK